jgi:nucleotide-binding universal stress UspA family protein
MEATIQTILVPTDLSDKVSNAIDYAVEIAKKANAKLILFHSYYIPTVVTDVSVVMPSIVEVENGIREDMERLQSDVAQRLGDPSKVSYTFLPGMPRDEIKRFAKECFADLIVMGMQGEGFIDEHLFGSVTVSVMRTAPCMVLSIGVKTDFKEIKQIALAFDYRTIEHPEKVFAPFKAFVKLLDAHVYILHIADNPLEVPTPDQAVVGLAIDHALEGVSHTFHQYQDAEVVHGLNEFIEKYKIDLLTMVPHEHTFLHNLIVGSETKRMAFRGNAPMLIVQI